MRLIESIEDQMNSIRTFELDDGRRVRLDARAVEDIGAAKLLAAMGIEVNKGKPVPVFHHGEMVGTVPFDFEPSLIRSKSRLYEPRRGDFERTKEGWKASPSLGGDDLMAIDGFKPA